MDNRPAAASLAFGILAWLMMLPVISPIVAIIAGHMGVSRAKKLNGRRKGMAVFGLILGYTNLVVTGMIVALFVVGHVLGNLQNV